MQYTVTRGEKGKVEVKVDVPKGAFDDAYGNALADLGRDLKVDGFRPGNIPHDVLEAKVGSTKVLNEAANFLVTKHLADIFDKEKIIPITKPKVAVDSLSRGAPFSFVASLVERPNVKVGDWEKVKVKSIKAKVITDDDVSASIKNIHQAWLENAKRKTQNASGDEDGDEEKNAGQKFISEQREETKGSADPNKVRVEKAFIYDAHGNKVFLKDDSGSPSSREATKDEIDDNFAKAVGARDLAHLREIVKKDLETIVTDQVEQKLEEELFEELVKISEVVVPDIMVDDEVNRIMMRLNSQLEQQGKKLEDWLREENTTVDALRAKWRSQAEKNVKATLVLDEIGRAENVQVSREEIENAGKGINQADLSPEQKVDMERYLAVSIFQTKTLDLVKKTVADSATNS